MIGPRTPSPIHTQEPLKEMLATVSSNHTRIWRPANNQHNPTTATLINPAAAIADANSLSEYELIACIKPLDALSNTPVQVTWGQPVSSSTHDSIYLCVTYKHCVCIYNPIGDLVHQIDPDIGTKATLIASYLIDHNQYVVYAATDNRVRIYDRLRGMDTEVYQPTPTPITSISISTHQSRYQYIALGTRTGAVHMIDRTKATDLVTLNSAFRGTITCIAVSGSSPTPIVVAGDSFGTVAYWHFYTSHHTTPVAVFDNIHQGHAVKAVCPSPVNKIAMISVASDSTMIMYDLVKGKQLKSFTYDHKLAFTCAAFRADGCSLAIGTSNRSDVVLVDLRRPGSPIGTLTTNNAGSVLSLAFTPALGSFRTNEIRGPETVQESPRSRALASFKNAVRSTNLSNIDAAFSPVRSKSPRRSQQNVLPQRPRAQTSPFRDNLMEEPMPLSPIHSARSPSPQNKQVVSSAPSSPKPLQDQKPSPSSPKPLQDQKPSPSSPKPLQDQTPGTDPTQFAIRMVRTGIEDVLMEVRDTLRTDIRNVHLELLQQCDDLRTEVSHLSKHVAELHGVMLENRRLKAEVSRLRVGYNGHSKIGGVLDLDHTYSKKTGSLR